MKNKEDSMKKFLLLFSFLLLLFCIAPTVTSAAFKDVNPNDYFAEAVDWAQKNNIVTGFPDNTFRPSNEVTEEQFLAIYVRFFDFQENKTIVEGEHWSNIYYRTLDDYNISVLGTTDIALKQAPINRGAVAELFGYSQGTTRNTPEAIQFLFDKGITKGKYPTKESLLDRYAAADLLKRGEVVTFLHRLYKENINTLHPDVKALKTSNLPNNKFTAKYTEVDFLKDDLYVGYINKKDEPLTIELFKNNTAVAGYLTAPGTTVNNFMIGKYYSSGDIYTETVNNRTYTYYFDKLDHNKLIGVFWKDNTFHSRDYFTSELTPQQSRNFSKLLVHLVNDYRNNNDLPPLTFNDSISQVAYNHSFDMHENNYFAHVNPHGLDVYDRVDNSGLYYHSIEKHGLVGENMAKIINDQGLFDAHHEWINSPAHRQHILYKHYTHAGLGVTNGLYTFLFITPTY